MSYLQKLIQMEQLLYSQRLKEIRNYLDISIAKMAKQLDMSESTLKSYIRNDRTASIDFLAKLHEIYKVNANWFLTGNGDMLITNKIDDTLIEKIEQIVENKFQERGL